jgi:hypothetical protein
MEQIHEILCIIVQLHSTSEIKGVLPTALLYDIAKFTQSVPVKDEYIHFKFFPRELERLFTVLNGQPTGTLGKIKRLLRQPETRDRLETCKKELSRMVELFKVCEKNCISMHIQICRLKFLVRPCLKWGQ